MSPELGSTERGGVATQEFEVSQLEDERVMANGSEQPSTSPSQERAPQDEPSVIDTYVDQARFDAESKAEIGARFQGGHEKLQQQYEGQELTSGGATLLRFREGTDGRFEMDWGAGWQEAQTDIRSHVSQLESGEVTHISDQLNGGAVEVLLSKQETAQGTEWIVGSHEWQLQTAEDSDDQPGEELGGLDDAQFIETFYGIDPAPDPDTDKGEQSIVQAAAQDTKGSDWTEQSDREEGLADISPVMPGAEVQPDSVVAADAALAGHESAEPIVNTLVTDGPFGQEATASTIDEPSTEATPGVAVVHKIATEESASESIDPTLPEQVSEDDPLNVVPLSPAQEVVASLHHGEGEQLVGPSGIFPTPPAPQEAPPTLVVDTAPVVTSVVTEPDVEQSAADTATFEQAILAASRTLKPEVAGISVAEEVLAAPSSEGTAVVAPKQGDYEATVAAATEEATLGESYILDSAVGEVSSVEEVRIDESAPVAADEQLAGTVPLAEREELVIEQPEHSPAVVVLEATHGRLIEHWSVKEAAQWPVAAESPVAAHIGSTKLRLQVGNQELLQLLPSEQSPEQTEVWDQLAQGEVAEVQLPGDGDVTVVTRTTPAGSEPQYTYEFRVAPTQTRQQEGTAQAALETYDWRVEREEPLTEMPVATSVAKGDSIESLAPKQEEPFKKAAVSATEVTSVRRVAGDREVLESSLEVLSERVISLDGYVAAQLAAQATNSPRRTRKKVRPPRPTQTLRLEVVGTNDAIDDTQSDQGASVVTRRGSSSAAANDAAAQLAA